jgi:hypothetical protein
MAGGGDIFMTNDFERYLIQSDLVQQEIEEIFRKKLQGKAEPKNHITKHAGAGGHWLERQFGIKPNKATQPDFKGYELKKETRGKTTFGDWSADKYLFSKSVSSCTRDEFIRIFGSPNPKKKNRYSWSGSCVPKVSKWNDFGQILYVGTNDDVYAIYNFKNDKRTDKSSIVPIKYQSGDVLLAIWKADSLRMAVEDKFDNLGWFSIKKDGSGRYNELVFGQKLSFPRWIQLVKDGVIFLDSGMVEGKNKRPYSQWRAANTFWESEIVRRIS